MIGTANEMIPNKDKESFSRFIVDRFSETYEYDFKEAELSDKDFRKTAIRGDINERYNDFKNFERTPSYHNTVKATGLLSQDFSISQDDLIHTLRATGMSKDEINDTLRQMANSKNVSLYRNTYTGLTSLRRKKS